MLGPEWKHKVTIYQQDWPAVQIWCEQYLGRFNEDWYKLGIDPMMNLNNGTIETVWYFKEEKKAMLFGLKWL